MSADTLGATLSKVVDTLRVAATTDSSGGAAWWGLAERAAAVIGVTAMGVLAGAWLGVKWVIRKLAERSDRKVFGGDYLILRRDAQRDGSFDTKGLTSLRTAIRVRSDELSQMVRRSVQEEMRQETSRLAAGSASVSYGEILAGAPLLMPCGTVTLDGTPRLEVAGLVKESAEARIPIDRSAPGYQRTLLLGKAGEGKSLLCLQAKYKLMNSQSGQAPWCLVISARDFEGDRPHDSDIGSREWCGRRIADRYVGGEPSPLEVRLLSELADSSAVLIVDGLDEIGQLLTYAELQSLLSSWLFARVAIATARLSFYYSHLLSARPLDGMRLLLLGTPTEASRKAFVRALCGRQRNADPGKVCALVLDMLGRLPSMAELTKTPLLLLMAAEVAAQAPEGPPFLDAIGVYERFVQEFVTKEVERSHKRISPTLMNHLVEDVAWLAFSSRNTQAGLPRVGQAGLRACIAQTFGSGDQDALDHIANALSTSALLSVPPSDRRGGGVVFNHETFAEFLIARRLYAWLLGDRSTGSDFFEHIETPEISFYVKEYLARLRAESEALRAGRVRLSQLVEDLSRARQSATDETKARLAAFALGQAAYYLGMVAGPEERKTLREFAHGETDFWVRRAAAIGLAMGGDASDYHALIDEMRGGIEAGDYTLSRKSIAMDLGFYGDQPFDRLDPSRDCGGEACRRLVTRVAHQARFAVEFANWRSDLFDLVYLGKYRSESKREFESVLREVRGSLEESLAVIEATSENSKYPEIREVREMLACFDVVPGAAGGDLP